MKKYLTTFLLLGFLTGCSSDLSLMKSFSNYDAESDTQTQGVYKIGAPYRINGKLYTPQENYSYVETGVAGWFKGTPGKVTANGEHYDPDMVTAMHKTLPLPSIVRVTNLENQKSMVVRVNDRGPFVNNRLIDVSEKVAQELQMPLEGTTLMRVEILPFESQALKKELGGEDINETTPQTGNDVIVSELEDNKPVGAPIPIYKPDDNYMKPIYAPETAPTYDQPETVNAAPVATGYFVQVGAFKNQMNALRLQRELNTNYNATNYQAIISEKQGESGPFYRVRVGSFADEEGAKNALTNLQQNGFEDARIILEK